ncbi:SAM pointed domain-containing Ets transcription factor [Eucyclogobius newberryi]|uniref:SAM pointed domain-containing Ets transcription factor n=1 Tax=Eucyclogobius newberryi TaxID=166745 RepID=UPI003B5A83EE
MSNSVRVEELSLYHSRMALADNCLTQLDHTRCPGWDLDNTKANMNSTERSGVPSLYLSCFDMLLTQDTQVSEASPTSAAPMTLLELRDEPEQCPIIDSQEQGLSPCGIEEQEEDRSLEQVQSMVVGEVLKDIETACKLLNITPDPFEWNSSHVQKWLLWTEHLYRLPHAGKVFHELSGKDLCDMSEEEFRQRSPLCGDTLHAHLDIWKSAAWMKERCSVTDTKASAGLWSEADSSSSGQPIHLWQFLKELLLKPHNYGRCIRWLNKEKGIFKIEDSAHVARLWGLRKNRPAMNYDKLSRSIRQYYKKGIIRKPDVSQRLVYQFVHPV